jgi:hypothetical protein
MTSFLKEPIVINLTNTDDYFSEIELFLNSFFDYSYATESQGLALENNCYKIVYEKLGAKYKLLLHVTSPSLVNNNYSLSFSHKPFNLHRPNAIKLINVSNLEFFCSDNCK